MTRQTPRQPAANPHGPRVSETNVKSYVGGGPCQSCQSCQSSPMLGESGSATPGTAGRGGVWRGSGGAAVPLSISLPVSISAMCFVHSDVGFLFFCFLFFCFLFFCFTYSSSPRS